MEYENGVVELDPQRKKKGAKYWQKEIDAAKKRLRKFQKVGNSVVARYLDEASSEDTSSTAPRRLNLFHKNVKTIIAMLNGQTPKVDVSREHYDPDDDAARVASLIFQRILQADIEPSGEDLPSVLEAVLQDRLLPGLGVARVMYEFETQKMQGIDPTTMMPIEVQQIVDEESEISYVHWQDFLWGWGRTWKEVPWVTFRSWMDKESCVARFGDDIADQLEYKNQLPMSGVENRDAMGDQDQKDNTQKAEIWEIWCKTEKKVYWYSEGSDKLLDEKENPLELNGFFPCPKPFAANLTTSLFIPKADFTFAQDLYNEVDILQARIATITRAIKVVGVYDKSAGDSVGRMLKEGMENDLIPVDNWAMFAEKGALQGVIDWFPVQEVVQTLQTLGVIQKEKIEQLYEVTGMSDIMRGGNTDQYAAAQTQMMKAKMGSIEIQSLQDEFARFASDLESLKAEVIAKHYTPQSIAKQSSAQFLPQADQQMIPAALQLIKSPDLKWRVNIKPETMSMIDYAQLKSERSEFLMSMAQFIQSGGALVKDMPDAMPLMLELMKWSMAGFKGAEYLEGTMDQAIKMAANQPPGGKEEQGPSPEQIKLQIEQMKLQGAQAKHQGEMQKLQMKSQLDMQTIQAKVQGEIAKITTDAKRDLTIEETQQQNKMMEIARELEATLAEIQAQTESSVQTEMTQAEMDIALEQERHRNNMAEIAAQGRSRSQ